MKVSLLTTAVLCFLSAGLTLSSSPAAQAQQSGQNPGIPKYLYLGNETIKPGMASTVIQEESAQVQALRTANAPAHYVGMISITGAPRAIFLAGYDSYAEMQKDHEQVFSDAKLRDTLRADNKAEGSSLAGATGSIYEYRKDLSLNPDVDISQMHFYDILLLQASSGHHQDLVRLAKLFAKAYSSMPDAHWVMYEKDFGEGSGETFIIVTPLKSLAGVDQEMVDGNNLPKAAGADQLQVMRELEAKTIKFHEDDLFAVVPQMSYVPASWVNASPNFWGKK